MIHFKINKKFLTITVFITFSMLLQGQTFETKNGEKYVLKELNDAPDKIHKNSIGLGGYFFDSFYILRFDHFNPKWYSISTFLGQGLSYRFDGSFFLTTWKSANPINRNFPIGKTNDSPLTTFIKVPTTTRHSVGLHMGMSKINTDRYATLSNDTGDVFPTIDGNSVFIGLTYQRVVNVNAKFRDKNKHRSYVLKVHMDYIKFYDAQFNSPSLQSINEDGNRLYAEYKTLARNYNHVGFSIMLGYSTRFTTLKPDELIYQMGVEFMF